MRMPGQIPAGTVSEVMFCSIDLLPTIARLSGAALPATPVDGRDVWDLLVGKPGVTHPHEYYAFTTGKQFEGVFSGDGRWKLHLPHTYRTLVTVGQNGKPGTYRQERIGLALFDMARDPYETTNLIDEQPAISARLRAIAERHRQTFFPIPRAD